jgi:hypothetical protein
VTAVSRTQQQSDFIAHVLGYAREASDALHIPVSAILAQWIDETGAGTSHLFETGYNFAGVSGNADLQVEKLGAHLEGDGFLYYPNHETGVRGYIMRWHDPVYASTRDAWAADNSPAGVARAMQDSPWAAGHYNHRDLQALIDSADLTEFDHGGGPVPAPGPGPDAPCSTLAPGPAPAGHSTLRIGAHGPEVAELQQLLATHGIIATNSRRADGSWDGIFGPHTATAVVELQEAHGLHADGIVGRQTWCALGVR